MATYTTNYNLEKPDASDPFGDFRESYNDNMDIIDANLGGGGGGGGHTIVDENGSDMPVESKLQFTGNVSVTDDNVNGATVVDVLGGGGDVYGAFLDPSRVIYSAFTFDNTEHSWTATEDVILTDDILPPSGSMAWYVRIDGKQVGAGHDLGNLFVYVKKGQVVTYRAKSGSTMKAYALIQGTNGIFAPVIYSDNERVIGVWRDNKPLYQRTFDLGSDTNISNSSWQTSVFSISDLEKIIVIHGVNSSGTAYPLNAYHTGDNVNLLACRDGNPANVRWITVQYTKTTDVAGSGDYNTLGVPTEHYSTNEQVIGTWIDGKPLYQKTVSFTTGNTSGYLNYLTDIENPDTMMINFGGSFYITGTAKVPAMAYFGTLNSSADTNAFAVLCNVDNGYLRLDYRVGTSAYSKTAYVTVQYTKTTD